MPSYADLVEAGRADLAGAVQRWGGAAAVATRLGLLNGLRPRCGSFLHSPQSLLAVCHHPGLYRGECPGTWWRLLPARAH